MILTLAAMLALQPAHQSHQPTPPPEAHEAPEAMDHSAMGHETPPAEPDAAPESEAMDHGDMSHEEMDHGAMDHGQMDHGAMGHHTPPAEPMDHGAMDHGSMDHGAMDHGAMGHDMAGDDAIPMGPPPREAGSGPARAAEAIYGEEAMARARRQLIAETGEQAFFGFMADRLETRLGGDSVGFLWDVQASYGPDLDKLWIESEGEGDFDEGVEGADIEATWSHAFTPWWDWQVGVRQDLAGSSRTWATVGVQGLAPYLFEVDAGAYLSSEGELTVEAEAELDQRVTQRLVLQPRAEIVLAAQDIPELGYTAGVGAVEAGLRLRYEFSREFAPYVGIAQEWRPGEERGTLDATRAVAGIRFWL